MAISGLLKKTQVSHADIDHVICGTVIQVGNSYAWFVIFVYACVYNLSSCIQLEFVCVYTMQLEFVYTCTMYMYILSSCIQLEFVCVYTIQLEFVYSD